MINHQGQNCRRHEQELNPERVMIGVIGGPELDIHEIQGGQRGTNENQLHHGVVQADEGRKEIQVARHIRYGKQNL